MQIRGIEIEQLLDKDFIKLILRCKKMKLDILYLADSHFDIMFNFAKFDSYFIGCKITSKSIIEFENGSTLKFISVGNLEKNKEGLEKLRGLRADVLIFKHLDYVDEDFFDTHFYTLLINSKQPKMYFTYV